jgi:hypothetical protein
MANSVIDRLTDWQNDADSVDTNLPNNATAMGDGQPGDLDGEFRRVKSEIRDLSLNMSWERWRGLRNVAGTGVIAFSYASANSFTVNDNFAVPGRNVATVGRRVKIFLSGVTLYGTITGASGGTTTTILVALDSGSLDASLFEVQFGTESKSLSGLGNLIELVRDVGEPVVSGVNVETGIYTEGIAGGLLGNSRFIHAGVDLLVTSILDQSELVLKFYYGGQLFFSPTLINQAGVQNNLGLIVNVRLHNRNATNIQIVSATIDMVPRNAFLYFDIANQFTSSIVTGLNVDSTANQLFQVNGLWSVASVSNSVSGVGLQIWG